MCIATGFAKVEDCFFVAMVINYKETLCKITYMVKDHAYLQTARNTTGNGKWVNDMEKVPQLFSILCKCIDDSCRGSAICEWR